MAISPETVKADWQAYETYRDDSRPWRESRDKLDHFVAGAQHQEAWSRELSNRNQSDIVVNRIRPLLVTRISAMIANKPTGKVYGTRKDDVGLAQVLEDFLDYHWYASLGQVVMERTVRRQQQNGVGYFIVFADNIADFGRGELRFGDVGYRNVFLDKSAGAHPLFHDAPVIIVSKLKRPMDYFNSLPPNIKKKIPQDDVGLYVPNDEIYWSGKREHNQDVVVHTPQSVTPAYPEEKAEWLRISDIYKRKVVNIPVIQQVQTGKVLRVLDEKEEPTVEEKTLMKKTLTEKDIVDLGLDLQNQPIKLFKLELSEAPIWRVEYYQQISGKMLVPGSEETLPISNYPVIPVIGEDMGNAMPYGEVDFQAGIQEMLNASIGLTLLNAALSSNWRVIVDAQKAGVTDLKKIAQEFSIPGAWVDMLSDPQTGKFPFEMLHPDPLPQAWFTLVQYFSQALEFQISTFALRSGDPSAAPETLGATLQLGQWAQEILRIPLNRLEIAIEQAFNVMLEWMPSFYTFHKKFDLLGVERDVNAPHWNETNAAWETMNSLADLKASFRIRIGSTTPSQTIHELNILNNLAQQQPALIGSVIDRLPGLRDSEKAEIKQTIDMVSQLGNQLQQSEEVIKTLQQQLQQLNQTVIALQRERAVRKVEPEVQRLIATMQQTRKSLEKSKNEKKK